MMFGWYISLCPFERHFWRCSELWFILIHLKRRGEMEANKIHLLKTQPKNLQLEATRIMATCIDQALEAAPPTTNHVRSCCQLPDGTRYRPYPQDYSGIWQRFHNFSRDKVGDKTIRLLNDIKSACAQTWCTILDLHSFLHWWATKIYEDNFPDES